jgi:two-component system chemotaxis response regulator CheY
VFIRNTVKKILSGVGYNVLGEADNGQSAVDMYNEFKPDLVTMDITMPVMEGTEAVKEILKDHPNACVVMLSAMGYRNLVKDCIMAGAKNFIVKPIKADNVKRVLEVLKSSLTT